MFNAATIKEDIYAKFIEKCKNSSTEELNSFLDIIFKDSELRPSINKSYLATWVEEINLVPSSYDNLAFSVAVKLGIVKIVQELLPNMINTPEIIFLNIFILAIENGHKEIVKILLKNEKIDPSAQDNLALQTAIRYSDKEIVEILLQNYRIDPSAQNNVALTTAISCGYKEIVIMLLADSRVLTTVPKWMYRDLFASLKGSDGGYIEFMQILLNNYLIESGTDRFKAIIEVLMNNYTFFVEELLLNDPHMELVKILLEHHLIDPAANDYTVLKFIMNKNDPEIFKNFKLYLGKLSEECVEEGLYHSVFHGQADIFKILLADASPNTKFEVALWNAAMYGNIEIIELLLGNVTAMMQLESQADTLQGSAEWAVNGGHLDIIKLLINNPNINASLDYEKLIELALQNKHNVIYSYLEANNKANHGFLTLWLTTQKAPQNDSEIQLLPEVIGEHIIKNYFYNKKQ